MSSSKPITIVRVIARLNIGGPAIQAILLTDAFRKRGYRALLLAGQLAKGEESMEYLAGQRQVHPISISKLGRKISLLRDLQSLCRLITILRHERPTIVHTHTAKAGTLGRLAAMIARVPVRVHTFHGHIFHGYFSASVTRFFIILERFLARHTDCVIAISESQRQELTEKYKIADLDKVAIVPLGFDLDPFLCVHEQPAQPPQSMISAPPVVGWIGRLTAIKAPELFIAGVKHVSCDAKFVMIGDGELRSACEEQIRTNKLIDKVRISGWRRDMANVYAGLDLLVLTSINEGTPLALLEAMASARSFIATDVGGIRDLMVGKSIKEHGWERFENGILIPRDADMIALAINFLITQPKLRRDMGAVGREFVKSRYSYDHLTNTLEKLYLRLARQKNCISLNA
ncbi:MAG TPA: glycosyltransferase family 4 protein, partial [Terriglobales bacterium]|nr:glycosyltransferase family 4 protein [Terriglobales bacterium]